MSDVMSMNPTGEQYEIISGPHRAVICELGGTIRRYSVGDHALLRGFAADQRVSGGRGQHLLPWPNRIRDGKYSFGGVDQQLVLSEPDKHNAIHGLTRYAVWGLTERTESSVTQSLTIFPQPGWAGIVQAELRHSVSDDGLLAEMTATNAGDQTVPFGYGAHPYLTVGEEEVDDVHLLLPAHSYLEVDERLLPADVKPVSGTDKDFRTSAQLGSTVLDTALTELDRGSDGRWRAQLRLGDRLAELWAGDGFDWMQVFTGKNTRRASIAVEPMTCGPDAFNPGPTHDGLLSLAPGDTFQGRWGIVGD